MKSIPTRRKPILINWLSLCINKLNDPNRQKTPATISNIKIYNKSGLTNFDKNVLEKCSTKKD